MKNGTVHFSIRLPADLKQEIEGLAAIENRSVANQTIVLLRTALRTRQSVEIASGIPRRQSSAIRRAEIQASA